MITAAAPVLSLLTDFGLQDPYVGIMKGVMAGIAPNVPLIDLTHAIPPQNIAVGAYQLEAAWPFFPRGSVHLAVVDPGVGGARLPLAVRAAGHFFVGPDNGLLESALACDDVKVYAATNPRFHLKTRSSTFHGRDIFAPVAAALAAGVAIEEVGPPFTAAVRLRLKAPQLQKEGLVGEVIVVDGFGNLITDLTEVLARPLFERGARLSVGPLSDLKLSRTYADVEEGEFVVVVGSTGRVEISVRGGAAAQRLGVTVGERVRVGLKVS